MPKKASTATEENRTARSPRVTNHPSKNAANQPVQIGRIAEIDEWMARAKRIVGQNLYSLRYEAMRISQQDMCQMLDNLSRAQYSEWESGRTLPSHAFAVYLRKTLSEKSSTAHLANFSIDDFFAREIDFKHLASPAGNELHDKFIGSYISYFCDMSEIRTNELETSRRRLSCIVMYIYERINNRGSSELAVRAARFKRPADAVEFKNDLDSFTLGLTRAEFESELNKFFSPEYDGHAAIGSNDLYHGEFKFFSDKKFEISLSSSAEEDEATMLFALPTLRNRYIGGLGFILSISRGILPRPAVQKIILSRGIPEIDEESIIKRLYFKDVNIPIDDTFISIIEAYDKMANIGGIALSPEERRYMFAYRMGRHISNYTSQINQIGHCLSAEEDNEVYHLLKHFAHF